MTIWDYTIICSGLFGGLMIVWLLFEIYCKAKKDLRDERYKKALLERLEAAYPKELVNNSSAGNQE
jgi:hypothetical protein